VDYKPRELLCKRPHQIAAQAMQSRAGVKYFTGFAARKELDTEEVVAMPRSPCGVVNERDVLDCERGHTGIDHAV
jgi:hypothetical protein